MGDSCQDASGANGWIRSSSPRKLFYGINGISHSFIAGFQEQLFQEILGKDARCPVAWSQKTKNDTSVGQANHSASFKEREHAGLFTTHRLSRCLDLIRFEVFTDEYCKED